MRRRISPLPVSSHELARSGCFHAIAGRRPVASEWGTPMSRTVLVAAMLVVAHALPAGAQVPAQQVAKEAKTKTRSRRAGTPATAPAASVEHHAPARALVKQVPATNPSPQAPGSQRSVAPAAPSSSKSAQSAAFTFSRFSDREGGTPPKSFHFSNSSSGVSAAPTKFPPFKVHSLNDRVDNTTMRTPGHDFRFNSSNEPSGTASQFEPFGFDDLNKGKHCIRVREGAFLRTRCF